MSAEVVAAKAWPTNAAMIADVARLGYLDGHVLDATYGEGNFWTEWRPEHLDTNDLHKPARHQWSYLQIPASDSTWDAVVFDPPYRLSGRRDQGEFDQRFGLAEYRSNDAILADIVAGARECYRVTRRSLLVKCQDQVNGGRVRWQTDLVTAAIGELGGKKVDRFDFIQTTVRGQPNGRRQLNARRNYSTLLIFEKPASARVTGEPML